MNNDKTFIEIMKRKFNEKNWTYADFSACTGLNRTYFSKLKRDLGTKAKPFDVKTIISVCFGLELTLEETEHLLTLCGLALSPEIAVHQAYLSFMLDIEKDIEDRVFIDIDDCNEYLKSLEVNTIYYLGNPGSR